MDPEVNSVDPEIKAYITNLVSALGGPDLVDSTRKYVLGDDALSCLRDLKRWLKGYDERLDRWDVARAISETSLVTSDLLEILTQWEQTNLSRSSGEPPNTHGDRIALACLELLVPLTWPLELDNTTSTNNHYRHYPILQLARMKYKRSILMHPKNMVLRAVLRLGVPALKMAKYDRTPRDDAILNLVVLFIRNLLAIEHDGSKDDQFDGGEDISRQATITVLNDQKVLGFLTTIGAGMGYQFELQNTAVLECLFFLLRGIPVSSIYEGAVTSSTEAPSAPARGGLSDLLATERSIRQDIQRGASSRHNRFGTMISMVVQDKGRLSISGQTALAGTAETLNRLDSSKKWHKPVYKQAQTGAWNLNVFLNPDARSQLSVFTSTFLDASFNCVFTDVRKLIEQDNDRLLEVHKMYFLYLVAWFLEAERSRKLESSHRVDYGIVGSSLNQNAFIVIMKLLHDSFEKGEHHNDEICYAAIICLKEILLTIQSMEQSGSKDDVEIAENMKTRLFYEEAALDVLAKLPANAAKKSSAYVADTIELVHIVLKMLETFSKQHTVHFIRSKRKQRKTKAAAAPDAEDDILNSEDENEESRRVTHERKFEFARFESKFIREATVDTYKKFLANYKELTSQQIKHALSFIHRTFVKREARALYFSLDFLKLLQDMTSKSSSGLAMSHPARKDVDRFLVHYVSKLVTTLERTPSLFTELLFDKMPETLFYYDHGHDKIKDAKTPRTTAEWVFRDSFGLSQERKVAIVVAALLDEEKRSIVEWVAEAVELVCTQREEWARQTNEEPGVKMLTTDADKLKTISKEGKLRLLLSVLGLRLESNGACIVPADLALHDLVLSSRWLRKYMSESVEFEDDAVAADYLRRKRPDESTESGDDEETSKPDSYMEEEGLFVVGDSEEEEEGAGLNFADPRFAAVPADERMAKELTAASDRKRRLELQASKKSGRKLKRKRSEAAPTGEKRTREPASQQAYKSSAFVHDSDDESDDERDRLFFESERTLREALQRAQQDGTELNAGRQTSTEFALEREVSIESTAPADFSNSPGPSSTPEQESPESILATNSERLFMSDSDDEVVASEKLSASRVKRRQVVIMDDDE